jgi:hypothetical protein
MNLVDEEYVTLLQVSQESRDVPGFFNCGSGSGAQFGAHLVRDDICEGCFAKAGGTSQQHVVQSFLPLHRSLHVDAKVFFYLPLANVIGEPIRTHRQLKLAFSVG